ncbi:MAG: hypothetical protein JWQ74_2216 [Marmoricola sp.]|nr:hypothetical protein [Marmoricola sp.]
MTQKRILRAKPRPIGRERDKLLRNAFRLHWAGAEDTEIVEILSRLNAENADAASLELFAMVNQLLDELVETTGVSRDSALARLQPW